MRNLTILLCLLFVGCGEKKEAECTLPKVDTVCLPLLGQWACGVTQTIYFNPILEHSEIIK